MLERARRKVEGLAGLPPLEKIPEVLELIKSFDAIPGKKIEQIKDILNLAKELQQATGSDGLVMAVELVRLVVEVPEERIKQVSLLIQRAEKLVKALPPEALGLLKEGAEELKEG